MASMRPARGGRYREADPVAPHQVLYSAAEHARERDGSLGIQISKSILEEVEVAREREGEKGKGRRLTLAAYVHRVKEAREGLRTCVIRLHKTQHNTRGKSKKRCAAGKRWCYRHHRGRPR